MPLPPYSPDLHRVIEHTHGSAEVAFQKWLHENRGKKTIDEYKQAFKDIYYKVNTQQSIRADVQGLPRLYQWVWENGGNLPPSHMR